MNLLDLPNELILLILESLELNDSPSLLRTATLCRRLHSLALGLYCARHHVDTSFNTIAIRCTNFRNDPIPGILLHPSIVNASPNHLSCYFSKLYTMPYSMIAEAKALTRLLTTLVSVQTVTLDLHMVLTSSKYTMSDWETALIELLEAAFRKTRVEINIHHSTSILYAWRYNHDKMHATTAPNTLSRPRHFLQSIARGRRPPPPRLVCRLSTLIPLYAQVNIRNIDMSMITELYISDIYSKDILHGDVELPAYIPSLPFPNLSLVSFFESAFWYTDIIHFLAINSSITSLHLRAVNIYDVYAPPKLSFPKVFLPMLTTLVCAPAHLAYLDRRKKLSPISICLSSGSHPTFRNPIDKVAEVFPHLNHYVQNIHLTLEIFSDSFIEEWFDIVGALSESARSERVETSLHCVERLEISTGHYYHLSPGVLDQIPSWLGLFPALEHVTFSDGSVGTIADKGRALVNRIAEKCPRLKTVKIEGCWFAIKIQEAV